jgi:hypothetical protein
LKECFEISLDNNFKTIDDPVKMFKSKNINVQSGDYLGLGGSDLIG